ncbi:putative quinol monooxygenase [Enterobacteriaceae bacterium LUAb1]
MRDKTLLVVAKLVAKPGLAEDLKNVLTAGIEPGRREAGNIYYELYCSTENPHVFLFYESWRDAAALAAHEKTAHFLKLMEDSAPLLASAPEITKI